MDVKLISVTPKGVRKSFSLNGPTMTLGRQPDCDLQVPHGLISRQHCQLQVNEDKLFIRDMKSANGTYVNGERVIHHELKAGDVIALTESIRFLVQIDGTPSQIDETKLQPGPLETKPKTQKAVAAKPEKVQAVVPPKAAAAPKPAAPPQPAFDADDKETDDILGESFFMDMDDEDDV